MFLTADEIRELTGLKNASAQLKQLRAMGIEAVIRADGKPVVSRTAVELRLGGMAALQSGQEPDWGALDAKKTA